MYIKTSVWLEANDEIDAAGMKPDFIATSFVFNENLRDAGVDGNHAISGAFDRHAEELGAIERKTCEVIISGKEI